MVTDLHADPDGRRIPHFLGIGAQKAGTTWLWQNLRIHPDICLPPRKELHFLDRHWDKGYTWYLGHFQPRRLKGRIAGEITPNYLVSDPARIATMRAINPDLKIMLLIRNPIDRAWSAARYYSTNRKHVSAEDLSLGEFAALARTRFVFERGDYRKGLERWEAEFGSDQIWVGFYDMIQNEPLRTFQSVLGFLGGDPKIDPGDFLLDTVFNAGPQADMPDQHREILEELWAPQIAWLAERFADREISWMN